ncbi:hypothetical protein HanRHA438_Chr11g0506361 [Helianthus annuus]|nr:hypothetical protein HanRHA438_Chr11g0506361 [Helianthus annuus]
MMNATMMLKQKEINFYIEECAKWKQELDGEKVENERIRRLLRSYTSSDYLIDRIYPTVAGFEAFKDEERSQRRKRILVRDRVSIITSVRLRFGKDIRLENRMRNKSKRRSI